MTEINLSIDDLSEVLRTAYDLDQNLAETIMHSLAKTQPGCEIVDDCLVVDTSVWYADDGNAESEFDVETRGEAAQQYVDGGDWGDDNQSGWVHVCTYRKGIAANGEVGAVDREWHRVEIEATVPDCEDGKEHDWQSPHELVGGIEENPGVWGHGGGAIIEECCMNCGCRKLTDTWAQDPQTGEQGLTQVSYEPGYFVLPELEDEDDED